MTEKSNPSINRPITAYETAGAIAYGGHGSNGFVVDGADPTELAVQDAGIDEAPLNSFVETSTASSLDVTIDPGEAFVFGSWIAIDTETTVSLAASTVNQTIYVGWNKNGTNDVIIGLPDAFSDASGDTDERIPLFTFDTDATGVTAVTDERTLGRLFGSETDLHVSANESVNVNIDDDNNSTTESFTISRDDNVRLLEVTEEGTLEVPRGGPADAGALHLGTNGGLIYVNNDGRIVLQDSAGVEQTVGNSPSRQAAVPLTTVENNNNAVALRQFVPSGKSIVVQEGGVQDETGATPTGLRIEVYDDTNNTVIYSVNANHEAATNLAEKAGAYDAVFRLVNETGSQINATGHIKYKLE